MSTFPGVGATFGRYDVQRLIGRGGMGVVYEARQHGLGRPVALKLLTPELADDPEFRERFEREAQTLAALDSPHIIQVYDAGEHDGVLFLATQLVAGEDLASRLRSSGPAAPDLALAVLADVASALGDAHDASVLHRDIKPGNVLLRGSGSVFAYLCDFGIARPAQSTLTRTSQVAGTIAYLAPECHTGAGASVASDVYSLGCCLWATLTGTAPYDGQTDYQVAMAHLRDDIPQLGGPDATSRRIDSILRRSLAKRPEERYASAHEMEEALRSARPTGAGRAPATTIRPVMTPETQQRAPVAATTPSRSPSGAGGNRRLLLAGAVVLALCVAAGIGVALTRHGGSGSSASLSGPASNAPAVAAKLSSAVVVSVDEEPTAVCPVGPTLAPSCRRERAKLTGVFPTLDAACVAHGKNNKVEELAAFECPYAGVIVRYSQWLGASHPGRETDGDVSKTSYFNSGYGPPFGTASTWVVRGHSTGTQWTANNPHKDPNLPYVWVAAYSGRAYSVIVKADSAKLRNSWRDKVTAAAANTRDTPKTDG